MTEVLHVDPEHPDPETIERAAAIIRSGGLVAFPTETVYGLGADATNEDAIRKVFEAKGRPADNPLIVHIDGRRMLSLVAREVSPAAERLIARFWPGPLTLVLQRAGTVSASVSAGLPTVAVRMPGNKIALEMIRRARTPVAAPSANTSGRPSPTRAEHVMSDLGGRIDLILDGGNTLIGVESTVLDMTCEQPVMLRPGWITREALAEVIGPIGEPASVEEQKRSPGTRYRHYSPRARMIVVEKSTPEFIRKLCSEALAGGPVGFIGHTPIRIDDDRFTSVVLGEDPKAYASQIYSALRELDEKRPALIVVEGICDAGEGAAVMDRLRRAASEILTTDGHR
ncbi:MAG TPA: L-threonylcarbamoyladenylate synthase [Blastocatellia bacterium]|nr:L-threonylcarbamoyladenylate synthase [Blastocatellia bacterium]